jgi:peroxiredoxin
MSGRRRGLLAAAGLALLALAALVLWYSGGQLAERLAAAPHPPPPLATIGGTRVIYPSSVVRPGDPAPDFALRALDGTTVRLSDLRGKKVLVNFWASWCVPCRNEMPEFQQAYADGSLVVLAVNALDLDDEEQARAFVKQLGFTYPVVFDDQGEVQRAYNVRGLPTSYLVGPDGTVIALQIGQVQADVLAEWLKK